MREDLVLHTPELSGGRRASAPRSPLRVPTLLQSAQAAQYCTMEQAFAATGGIVASEEMVGRLRRRTDQPISRLARWIVDREVLSFQWHGHTMLPMFQFDPHSLAPYAEFTTALRELVPALSDWEIAVWFATPNVWLEERSPVDAILSDAAAVFDAALAERFLARG
ncbi:MAG TPA: hypothetical protein VHL79_02280 [Ramlibacter sp.]|jgi:hypothetical protein|nr:hypothetical protein [Ramlibacter sp.]